MGNAGLISEQGLHRAAPVRTFALPHQGTVTLLRGEGGECLLRTVAFSDCFLLEERMRRLKTRVGKGGSAHVVEVYQVVRVEKKELCASNYQLQVYLEYCPLSLTAAIAGRLKERRNFSEAELFTFLARAVDSLLYMQDNGLKNIQLDGDAIFMVNDGVKILDSTIATSKSYYQLLDAQTQQHRTHPLQSTVYLAPELLRELRQQNYDPYMSPKADVFSLGMLLLEMVTLEPMQGYYDYDCASIDYDSLIHRLSRIAHSLPLKTILAEMLEHDPEERIGLVSLKEKLQALRTPPQPPITRSKSSKMLKDLLSQSRRSSSKREQSSDRKAREESKPEESSRECSQESSVQKPALKVREKDEKVQNNNIDQAQFRNLVKNRLKDRNKENPRIESAAAKQDKVEVQSSFAKVQRASVLQEQSGNGPKFESSMGSKQFECSAQSSLSKLVEGSGLRSLLKLQQLDSDMRTSQPESLKHTSRFGSQLAAESKQPELHTEKVVGTARGGRGGFAQKGMTFNNKEFLISARSVEQSVNDELPRSQEERLVFSPIRAEEGQESCEVGQSPQLKITIRDVPVVVSQEKVMEMKRENGHFGRLQRQLQMLECAQSIEQDSFNSAHNVSNVIESFPHHPPPEEDSSAFFKKRKPPQLNLRLQDEDYPRPNNNKTALETLYKTSKSIEQFSNFASLSPSRAFPSTLPLPSTLPNNPSHFAPEDSGNYCRVVLPSGEVYQGETSRMGEPEGNGVLYSGGEMRYSGSFRGGKFSGFGTLFNLEPRIGVVEHSRIELAEGLWVRYEGEFQGGRRSGFGTIYFPRGQKFSGCLRQDVVEGYGCFYRASGELVSGLWSENRFRQL